MNQDLEALKKHPSVLRLFLSRLSWSKSSDREYLTSCPGHSDSNPSLTLNDKKGLWLFFCFGTCKKTGSIIDFIQWVDNVDLKTAIKTVSDFCNDSWEGQKERVEKVFRPATPEPEKKHITYTLEQWKTFEDELQRSREGQEWLRSRGISYETAKALHWGFRKDISKFCKDEVADQGWVAFPYLEGATVVCIKYRSVVKKAFARQPNMKTVLYNTNDIDVLEPLFLVEGEPDVASLKQAGFRAISLPSASTTPTAEMKDQMMGGEYLLLAGDADEAGGKIMNRLWAELQERCYRLNWNGGCKDANDVFRKTCGSNVAAFREHVLQRAEKAKGQPAPNIYSLQDVLTSSERTNLSDHPDRLRFPWPAVDKFAVLLPGSVLAVFSTNTKMAKTTLVMNATVYQARKCGEKVLNYSAELQPSELGAMVASHVLKKDRNHLTERDNESAAKLLGGVNYWIGRDPTLTTIEPVLDLIEAAVRRLGITVVVLDTLHFFTTGEGSVQVQEAAMQRMKLMATRYGLKFIVVCQPRKAKDSDKGKRVHITDLKGSEAVGSSADAIFALHREYVKEKTVESQDEYEARSELHLLAARSRGDGGVMAELWFLGKLASFVEPSQVATEQDSRPSLFQNS